MSEILDLSFRDFAIYHPERSLEQTDHGGLRQAQSKDPHFRMTIQKNKWLNVHLYPHQSPHPSVAKSRTASAAADAVLISTDP
jgi:hypothetical protein